MLFLGQWQLELTQVIHFELGTIKILNLSSSSKRSLKALENGAKVRTINGAHFVGTGRMKG